MYFLAIDSSSKIDSIAICKDEILASATFMIPSMQSELLPEQISFLLDSLDIDKKKVSKVAFINGPGSFIGTRIAISCALAFDAEIFYLDKYDLTEWYFNKKGCFNKRGVFIHKELEIEKELVENRENSRDLEYISIDMLPSNRAKLVCEYFLSGKELNSYKD